MKKRKIWILLTAILLILSITVVGTLAFLIDSAEVINTFTVGNVALKLDEAALDASGAVDTSAERVTENEYHLLPGGTYPKDPTVTVLKGSEDAYVRMIMTVHNHEAIQAIVDSPRHGLNGDYQGLFDGWDNTVWLYETFTVDSDADTISFEFRYFETVDASKATEDVVLEPLFTSLVVPGTVSGDELAALVGEGDALFQINVEAHAIQSYSFDDADAAWAAFDEQYAYEESAAAATTAGDSSQTVETDPANP